MHTRKLIRDAVAALVTGLPTTGNRVLIGRTRSLAAGHLPTLLIYTTEEQSDRPMEGNPGGLGRDLLLAIEGRTSTATPPDDLLDAIASEVEGQLRDTRPAPSRSLSILGPDRIGQLGREARSPLPRLSSRPTRPFR